MPSFDPFHFDINIQIKNAIQQNGCTPFCFYSSTKNEVKMKSLNLMQVIGHLGSDPEVVAEKLKTSK